MDVSFLDSIGGPQTLIIAAAVVTALIVLRRLFAKRPVSSHMEPRRCGQCGFVGQMSRHRPVCPRCGKAP